MRLNFFVQGRPQGSSPPTDSYLDSLAEWTNDKASALSELTLDESLEWARRFAQDTKESLQRLFRYLSGAPLPPPPLRTLPPPDSSDALQKGENAWSFAGLFSGIRGPKMSSQTSTMREPGDQAWTDGEVHVDLVMVRRTSISSPPTLGVDADDRMARVTSFSDTY
jgi:import inner membrane translocase subunit TIM21